MHSWCCNDFQTSFYDTIELHAATVDWHRMMSGIKDLGPNEVCSVSGVCVASPKHSLHAKFHLHGFSISFKRA
jgi:hypothetical protein